MVGASGVAQWSVGAAMTGAPVLHVANVFDRALCQQLMRAHDAASFPGTSVGVVNGAFQGIVDKRRKNRRDHKVSGELLAEVWRRLSARAWPLVQQCFQYAITRFEYIHVGCYDGAEQGHFVPHRDNDSPVTAHRRFALSLNLNDDYDAGEIYFPEFRDATYRPASGSGVVFSCSLVHGAAPVTRGKRYVLVAMLGGDDDLAIYEAARGIRRPSPIARLVDDARRLRRVAGDVIALGERTPSHALARLDRVHRELARVEGELRAARPAAPAIQPGERAKLHLGAGPHRLAGWVNIDARGGDVRMDLRWPLPFPDASVSFVFASHVIEHLHRGDELPRLLAEIRRVLAPGGVVRVVVPDLEACLRAYVTGDDRFFVDRARTWPWAAACKTRLDHFLAYAGAGHQLEDFDGHKYGYDFETLAHVLRRAGFTRVERSGFMASHHAELRVDAVSPTAAAATGDRHYSLFVEAS